MLFSLRLLGAKMLLDINKFNMKIVDRGQFSKYKKVWQNAYAVAEYRAPYDSNMKVFARQHRPENAEIEDIIEWMQNNIAGSWKIVLDVGVMPDNTCDYLNDDFSLLFSREEDYVQYKLTWA